MPKFLLEGEIAETTFLTKLAFELKETILKDQIRTSDGKSYRGYILDTVIESIKRDLTLDSTLLEDTKERILLQIKESLEEETRKKTKEYLAKIENEFKYRYQNINHIIDTELSNSAIKKIVTHLVGAQIGNRIKEVVSKILSQLESI